MGLSDPVPIRLHPEDVERLERLHAMFPSMSKTALAREALSRGLDLFDEALKIKDAMERNSEVARLAGMIGTQRRGRR